MTAQDAIRRCAREQSKIWENSADYRFNVADTALYNRMNVLDQLIGFFTNVVENWLSSLINFLRRKIKITPLKMI